MNLSRDSDDPEYQLRGLWGLWATRVNAGALRASLVLAEDFSVLAQSTSETDRCVGHRMMGHSLHLLGDQAGAREQLQSMLASYAPPATGAQTMRYIFDQQALARCFLARIYWLQGFPDQARQIAWEVTNDERARGDALSLCQVLVQAACPVGLMVGELSAVDGFVAELIGTSERYQWHFWRAFGACFRSVLTVQRGDIPGGLALLEEALKGLRGIDFGVHYLYFSASTPLRSDLPGEAIRRWPPSSRRLNGLITTMSGGALPKCCASRLSCCIVGASATRRIARCRPHANGRRSRARYPGRCGSPRALRECRKTPGVLPPRVRS